MRLGLGASARPSTRPSGVSPRDATGRQASVARHRRHFYRGHVQPTMALPNLQPDGVKTNLRRLRPQLATRIMVLPPACLASAGGNYRGVAKRRIISASADAVRAWPRPAD